MHNELKYWYCIIKRVFVIFVICLLIFISFKLALFYIPFIFAFIISLIIEPFIKILMNKFRISRRFSSIIVFTVTFGIIILLVIWAVTTLISESSNLLNSFNDNYEKISELIQNIIYRINFSKLKISSNLMNILEKSIFSALENLSELFQNLLTNIVTKLTTLPTIFLYVAITILSLYFICTDRIYMLDELEHHLPDKWMKKITRTYKRIN